MAEMLTPKPEQRPPFSSSLKTPFYISENDDELERARARAVRATTIRRRTAAATSAAAATAGKPFLVKEQIMELFQNCIKLASENKINQKNTWDLQLIDHLCEIVKDEEENGSETNFQKASCTLEAGVKIYSLRVDYVHSEAYKVLGRINRVGQEDEQDLIAKDQDSTKAHKEHQQKLSPLATVETSFAALNVKKFDVAFVVDPLYHQTSAQFDEGGVKGLLLNNLGVYANCRVLFDSLEVPGKCVSSVAQRDGMETIDLSFAKDCIESVVENMLNTVEISPSLKAIINQFGEENQRPSEEFCYEKVNENSDTNINFEGDAFGNCGAWDSDHDDQASMVDEGTYYQDTHLPNHQEVGVQFNFHDTVEGDGFDEVDGFLFPFLGRLTKQNAWAGPNHWKYRKAKNPEDQGKEKSPTTNIRKTKRADSDIDFTSSLDMDAPGIFAPPKKPKSLLLPANRAPCNTKLPEDCHYQPEDLVKLFLLPNVLCLGRSDRKRTDEASQQNDDYGGTACWDDEEGGGSTFDDGQAYYSDIEESSTLVPPPRQVSTIDVKYDRTFKQVDVHALKETLWDHIQTLNQITVQEDATEENISFKQLLANFPNNCKAAVSPDDISLHLCFICLLHLANEHGLWICGCSNLDDLNIQLKPE